MNYTKPEVAILGQAVRVIESVQSKPPLHSSDATKTNINPAYDLDE